MSIQTKDYTSKRTGKTTTSYYAVVFDAKSNKSVWSKGFKTERDAKREEARLIHALEEDTLISKKIKFDEALEQWLNHAEGKYANSTYRGYEWYCGAYIKPSFKGKSIDIILPVHIQKFVDAMSMKYSAETVNKCINILTNIFNYAREFLYAVKTNPVDAVKRRKVVPRKYVTWKPEQISDFLNYEKVITSNYYELILTSFLLGARPSEVCGLRLHDLKPNRVLKFERGYDQYGEETDMKNQRSHREVTISKEHYTRLIIRLKKQNFQAIQRAQKSKKYDNNDFLFKQSNGRPINPGVYSKNFKNLLISYNDNHAEDDLPLPHICLYEARHSFATNLVTGENIGTPLVASIMGNSERTCNDRYVHPYQDAKESVIIAYQQGILESKKIAYAN